MSGAGASIELIGDREPNAVTVENLGFKALNGDKKVRLYPQGYSVDDLPPPSSSLLAVANKRGLYAAAGPSTFVLGSTKLLRDAFADDAADYTPQVTITPPGKITHVAFNADESYLLIAAGDSLIAYKLDELSNGGSTSAEFEVSVAGGLRELKPNPAFQNLVAVVTEKGDVRILDLATRNWNTGADGEVLKSNASTVCWSKLGKQIVCGLLDGTGWQMTPQGEGKAVLPCPPEVEGFFLSNIRWVENNVFLLTHVPVPKDGGEPDNEAVYHTLSRTPTQFTFRRFADPSPPFGMEARAPPYFFTTHVRSYPPNLKDAVIYASTCSSDVGIVVRFDQAVGEAPADEFVATIQLDDSRRIQLPLTEPDYTDSSPIGVVLDLSSKDNVKRPVGGEEIDESPGPLPILMVLTHEGYLCAWHIVYNHAIEKGEKYPGMMMYQEETASATAPPVAQAQASAAPAAAPSPFASAQPATAFGQSAFGKPAATPSPFGQPSAFGAATTPAKPAFGAPAFGQSGFGAAAKPASPWGAPAAGTSSPAPAAASPAPAFGKPAALGSGTAFGQPAPLGANTAFGKPSPLGGSAFGKPAFGTPAPLGGSPAPAVTATSTFGSGSGFGAYANKGGFAAAAAAANAGASPFGSGKLPPSTTPSVFGSGKPVSTESTSVFGSGSTTTASPFGAPAGGFKLSSGFKADPNQKEDDKKEDTGSSGFGGLGSGFGAALESAASTSSPFGGNTSTASPFAASTSTASPFASAPKGPSPFSGASQPNPFGSSSSTSSGANPFGTPTNKPAPSPFGAPTSAAPASPFANLGSTSSPFANAGTSSPFASKPNPFAASTGSSAGVNPFGTPSKPITSTPSAPDEKDEDESDQESADNESWVSEGDAPPAPLPPSPKIGSLKGEDAPLPPDPTSRDVYQPGSSTGSLPESDAEGSDDEVVEEEEEAPLPPDFTAQGPEDNGSDLEDEEEDGDEDDEQDQDEDEEEESKDDKPETPAKPSLFSFTPKPKTPGSEQKTGDSIFSGGASYKSTFGGGKIDEKSPFSSFLTNKPKPEDIESESEDDDDDEDDDEPPASKGKAAKNRNRRESANNKSAPKFGKTSASKKGGLFGTTPPKKEEQKDKAEKAEGTSLFGSKTPGSAFGAPAAAGSSSSLFGATSGAKPSTGSLFGSTEKPADKPAAAPASLFGSPKPAGSSLFGQSADRPSSAPPQPSAFGSKPVAPSPLAAQPQIKREPTPEPPKPKEEPVDFNRVYPDYEDEKIRIQLQQAPLVPTDTLPPMRKLEEIEVPDDFEAVFDSIYQSGNMMVNKLGQVARDLRAYSMGQSTKKEGVTHNGVEDFADAENWRLCEMEIIGKVVDEMSSKVKEIKKDLPELEKKHHDASKGFIKLDTKTQEIRRLLAPHINPSLASADPRNRILAPEQQLQQRALRKSLLRAEKQLKEAEHAATMLKAKIAAKNRHKKNARVVPPTVEAVRNTVVKLTGMVEAKARDVEYLEDKVRRLRGRSATPQGTPGRETSFMSSVGGTPMRGVGTPLRTPMRGTPQRALMTPVLALVEEQDVEEVREETGRRRERGERIRKALEVRAGQPGK